MKVVNIVITVRHIDIFFIKKYRT